MCAESEPKLLARTDGMTGLNCCRMVGEILDEERCRTPRTRSMFSLLFVNIDWFKA
jgi:PleD family two-component response regulator